MALSILNHLESSKVLMLNSRHLRCLALHGLPGHLEKSCPSQVFWTGTEKHPFPQATGEAVGGILQCQSEDAIVS